MSCQRTQSTKNYTITDATENDKKEVYDLLCSDFFYDMPLYKAFQQTEPMSIDEWPAVQTLHERISLKAVSTQGSMVGVALNVLPRAGEVVGIPPKLSAFFNAVDRASNYLLSELEKNYMEIRCLAVAKEYRNQGIAIELMEKSVALAKKLGGKKIFGMSTGAYIAKAFDKAGWTNVFHYNYCDYKEEPHFLLPEEPHTFLRLYVKEL